MGAPTFVANMEELEALPEFTVVRDSEGVPWLLCHVIRADGDLDVWAQSIASGRRHFTVDVVLPATVLTAPSTETGKPRRRQRIAVLGATYGDAQHEAQYLPREAEVVLLSARATAPLTSGHGSVVDALFITPSALILEAARIERLIPSLTPMFATRKRPEVTS